MLAIAPLEATPRVVHLAPAEHAAIAAECEAYPEPPAFPCRATCALCGDALAADDANGLGAHRQCSDDAMREIENDQHDEWVRMMERTYGETPKIP